MLEKQISYLNEEGELLEPHPICDRDKSIKLVSKAALKNFWDYSSRHSQNEGLLSKVKINQDFYPKEPNDIEKQSKKNRILAIRNFQNAYGFNALSVSGCENIIKFATVTAMALDLLEKNTGPGNEKNRKKLRKEVNK